jgi:hypothetical protein
VNLSDLLNQLFASPTGTGLAGVVLTALLVKYPAVLAFLSRLRVPTPPPAAPPAPVPQPAPGAPVLNELLVALLSLLMGKHATADPAEAVAREMAAQRTLPSSPPPSP